MAVLGAVTEALAHGPGAEWQRALALALAAEMDSKPSASTAKELRALMVELGVDGVTVTKDPADDLAAKRAERRRAASS